jgi:hypothetical protein
MPPELPYLYSVQPGIQKWWTRLAALASQIDAEASHHHPALTNKPGAPAADCSGSIQF